MRSSRPRTPRPPPCRKAATFSKASSRCLGRPVPSPGGPFGTNENSVRLTVGLRHGYSTDRLTRALHAGAIGAAAAHLDDRAAGNDAVVLVPAIQPAEPD